MLEDDQDGSNVGGASKSAQDASNGEVRLEKGVSKSAMVKGVKSPA